MDDDHASQTKKIKSETKQILSDHKNANLILNILKTTQSKSDRVICASCQAIGEIFAHFIGKQYLVGSKTTVAEADLSKEDQFSSWLKEQFGAACDVLSDHLCHESEEVQKSSFSALVKILEAESESTSGGVSGKVMEIIVFQFLSSEFDQKNVIELFSSALSASEKNMTLSLLCLKYIKKRLKHVDQPPTDLFLFNTLRVLKQVAKQDLSNKSKAQLTASVCSFLKHKMPVSLYREILTGISVIMEKMSDPLRLADFLTESFDIGGAVSLMSLHGLFILMLQYNLDYPDFYTKLYSMFEPQVFSAKYRARFFHLADTFLSSTHLPAYLVAAFAKRLARLSLHAPTTALHITVPFITNLLSRHPACEVLLHRTEGKTEFDADPFLPDETDLSKCKAMDSCLWELETLERHFDPTLAQKAKKRQVVETDLSTLLENTTSDLIASEAKKIKKGVPITFERVSELKLAGDFTL